MLTFGMTVTLDPHETEAVIMAIRAYLKAERKKPTFVPRNGWALFRDWVKILVKELPGDPEIQAIDGDAWAICVILGANHEREGGLTETLQSVFKRCLAATNQVLAEIEVEPELLFEKELEARLGIKRLDLSRGGGRPC